MASYGAKYSFSLESYNGYTYQVIISEGGYSGTVTKRPLGKAPVIRMQDSSPFRTTSCDLVLECQVDGEFTDLYTTDPFHFQVSVYRGQTLIWTGFIATEIYSEPDIAPPYDVKVTATDGIGILKEYTYEAAGAKTIREHICDMLTMAGSVSPALYYATQLSEYQGTASAFLDGAHINLDYMVGESCYDVLKTLLESLRTVLIYLGDAWLLVREVDAQINSSGVLTVVSCVGGNASSSPSTSTTLKLGQSVGQMGVADLWPVGYLTRRVVPAKKSVSVRSAWHYLNGFPKVADNGWSMDGDYTSFDSTNKLYHIGQRSYSFYTAQGAVYQSKILFCFNDNLVVRIKANAHSVFGDDSNITHRISVSARWSSGSDSYYWTSDSGWTTENRATGEDISVEETNDAHDPNACKVVEITIPPLPDDHTGLLRIRVDGSLVDIYDIEVTPLTVAGYEDHIFIDNGSRGDAGMIDILGGRLLETNFIGLDFYQGVLFLSSTSGGITTTSPILHFSDGSNSNKDFMSITALAYAKEVAGRRLEITGTLDHVYNDPSAIRGVAPFIKSHGVWALMKSYDWNMQTEDVSFTAVTIPTTTLEVEDESIISTNNTGSSSGSSSSGGIGSSSGGGGGPSFFQLDENGDITLKPQYQNLWVPGWLAAGGVGSGSGGGGSYTAGTGIDITNNVISLKTASTSVLGGVKVDGTTITINNGVISAVGGGGGTTYTAGYGISISSNNTISLKAASENEIGGLRVKVPSSDPSSINAISTTSGRYYYIQRTSGGTAFVNVPWESGGGGGISSVSLTSGTTNGTLRLTVDGVTGSNVSVYGLGSLAYKSSLVASDIPDISGKYVTLDTTQNNISGEKTFTTNPVHIGATSGIDVNSSSYIDIGNVRLVYDSGTNALHVTKKSGSQAVGLYADGFVAAGGISGQTTSSYVDLESNQDVGGIKTFTGTTTILSGKVLIGATSTPLSSKLYVNGDASFKYDASHTISISNIVSRLEALE